jgi:hypothetical protein
LLVAAVAVGLVAMHQLTGMPTHDAHSATPPPAHAVLSTHPDGEHCPEQGHCHPGQVCQPHQGSNGPDGIPALVPAPTVPVEPPLLTARTAASEAGEGTGCGPPGLADLALLRI